MCTAIHRTYSDISGIEAHPQTLARFRRAFGSRDFETRACLIPIECGTIGVVLNQCGTQQANCCRVVLLLLEPFGQSEAVHHRWRTFDSVLQLFQRKFFLEERGQGIEASASAQRALSQFNDDEVNPRSQRLEKRMAQNQKYSICRLLASASIQIVNPSCSSINGVPHAESNGSNGF